MPSQLMFSIDEHSQVGNAPACGGGAGQAAAVRRDAAPGKVGLAVTELRHEHREARRQRPDASAARSSSEGIGGIEVIALDKGPGIADVAASLRDGHSTRGTLGAGPRRAVAPGGRVRDLHAARARHGAAAASCGRREPLRRSQPPSSSAASALPKHGETVSAATAGASKTTATSSRCCWPMGSATASRRTRPPARPPRRSLPIRELEPQALIEACHGALARTRGAAVAVAQLVSSGAERGHVRRGGQYRRPRRRRRPPIATSSRYNGTVGHTLRKVQEFAFPWPTGALLILHSDGLGTHWDLAAYPGPRGPASGA